MSITISNDVPIGLLFIVILHMAYTMYWMRTYHRQTVAELHQQLAGVRTAPQPAPAENRNPALKTCW
ncbi:MAG: hypothetical protein EOP49_39795 [Sphingobacteriales bacterium]|nr:MAG: hypothetical protein EOP49_39795 [Sphingobacteriales bacterium]